MTARFEELDWRPTPLGELVLRRRLDPVSGRQVHEIKLGDEFLMSSMFTASEVALGRLALGRLDGTGLDVVVGGLGLGFTARTVLESTAVRSLVVVDALAEVIEWHERGLIPAGAELTADPRCRFAHGDFFTMARSADGLDPAEPGRRFHAVVVDIDHSPRHLLHPDNAVFYTPAGLRHLTSMLHPGGVFALWSNDPPDAEFTEVLSGVFVDAAAEVVTFDNPLQQRDATATVYLGSVPPA
ncbi:spermidine synthase family protein [Actinokineospora spheciospongiae]|uniref:spermidine synthase n=1 Tax=Actinokineospora spheciospongiae TaxID=909613 RepID=UPI000D715FC9|nr:spermidine synthase [Actinokineospora spheciospongiae]PWW63475.1 hypothetical protein DFQ13_104467 [Actinokineospora spheciospongiae]